MKMFPTSNFVSKNTWNKWEMTTQDNIRKANLGWFKKALDKGIDSKRLREHTHAPSLKAIKMPELFIFT